MTNDKEVHYKRWTVEDDNFLMERYYSERLIDLARQLGCSRSTVTHHARRLGLWKGNTAERNRDAIALVEMEHDNLTYKELAQQTGMTVKTVCRYARMRGLRAATSSGVPTSAASARNSMAGNGHASPSALSSGQS